MSLAFLSPTASTDGAVARSPIERMAKAAGARFEIRDGWNVAVEYPGEDRAAESVAWADFSHLRKWELRGTGSGGELGTARPEGDAWYCGVTADRALVLGGMGRNYGHADVCTQTADAIDVTCNYAALTILGPNARETIARFCAIDLRPHTSPPHSFRPGSIARQPGMILVEAPDRFLLLFGWAIGEYMWNVVEDAARHLGGAPIGMDALASRQAQEVEASA